MNADAILNLIHRVTAPLRQRVSAMVAQVVIDAVNDSPKFQELKVKVLEGEVLDGIPHLQPGGLTHNPDGGEGLLLSISGQRDNAVVICVTSRDRRPTGLNAGETALYTTRGGEEGSFGGGIRILLDNQGQVQITPKSGQLCLVNGSLRVEGTIVATGEVYANAGASTQTTLSGHKHSAPMGPTTSPIVPEV